MAYNVRIYHKKNENALLQLWQQIIKKHEQRDIKNMYSDNSYGVPSAWLLFSETEDHPVGSITVFPRIMKIGTLLLKTGFNCDILTLKRHRTLGPAIQMVKKSIKDAEGLGYKLIIAFPNQMSQPVFKRAGYSKIGTAVRWSKVLKSENKLEKYIKNKIMRKILAWIIDKTSIFFFNVIWMHVFLWKKWRKITQSSWSIDALETMHLSNSSGLSVYCNLEYLYWRYAKACSKKSKIIIWKNADNFIGYIVFSVENNNAIIETMYFPSKKSLDAHTIMSAYIKKMRKIGCESIQILHYGSEKIKKLLQMHGFLQRPGRDVYINIIDKSYSDLSYLIHNVDLFDGDLDF